MSHYILDVAYKIMEKGGVVAQRFLVQGENAGDAVLPATCNAAGLLGVTVSGQSVQGQNVGVRKAGIASAEAAGPIPVGAPVNCDGAGRVKAIDEPAGTLINCLGFAETGSTRKGDIIEVFISLHQRVAE